MAMAIRSVSMLCVLMLVLFQFENCVAQSSQNVSSDDTAGQNRTLIRTRRGSAPFQPSAGSNINAKMTSLFIDMIGERRKQWFGGCLAYTNGLRFMDDSGDFTIESFVTLTPPWTKANHCADYCRNLPACVRWTRADWNGRCFFFKRTGSLHPNGVREVRESGWIAGGWKSNCDNPMHDTANRETLRCGEEIYIGNGEARVAGTSYRWRFTAATRMTLTITVRKRSDVAYGDVEIKVFHVETEQMVSSRYGTATSLTKDEFKWTGIVNQGAHLISIANNERWNHYDVKLECGTPFTFSWRCKTVNPTHWDDSKADMTMEQCMAWCDESDDCDLVTLNEERPGIDITSRTRGRCYRLPSEGSKLARGVYAGCSHNDWATGRKESPEKFLTSSSVRGYNHFDETPANDLATCKQQCLDAEGCELFTFDADRTHCFQFKLAKVELKSASTDWVTGRKLSTIKAPYIIGVGMRGFGHFAESRQADMAGCQASCTDRWNCVMFTYHDSWNYCWLHAKAGAFFKKGHDGYAVGWRAETIPEKCKSSPIGVTNCGGTAVDTSCAAPQCGVGYQLRAGLDLKCLSGRKWNHASPCVSRVKKCESSPTGVTNCGGNTAVGSFCVAPMCDVEYKQLPDGLILKCLPGRKWSHTSPCVSIIPGKPAHPPQITKIHTPQRNQTLHIEWELVPKTAFHAIYLWGAEGDGKWTNVWYESRYGHSYDVEFNKFEKFLGKTYVAYSAQYSGATREPRS
eukprot:786277_1